MPKFPGENPDLNILHVLNAIYKLSEYNMLKKKVFVLLIVV